MATETGFSSVGLSRRLGLARIGGFDRPGYPGYGRIVPEAAGIAATWTLSRTE